jgi:hypothetical protein
MYEVCTNTLFIFETDSHNEAMMVFSEWCRHAHNPTSEAYGAAVQCEYRGKPFLKYDPSL